MKKGISLVMALLLVVGSLSTLAACDKGNDTNSKDEVTTQDRTPSEDEDTTEKAGGDVTTDGKDPFGGNDAEDTTVSDSGENEKPLNNYTVDSFTDFNEGIVVYQGTITAEDGSQKVGYGYMDSTGKVITPPIYEKACVFYNGLAAVVKGENQKGYIDTTGKEVIPCIYSSITMAIDTLTWVTTTDGVEQMINTKGEVVYTATGKEVAKGYYKNGYFWIETVEEKFSGDVYTMTYYNEKGEIAFSIENAKHIEDILSSYTEFLDAASFGYSNFNKEGYAVVNLSGRYWFIDKKGNIVDLEVDDLANQSLEWKKGNWYEAGSWFGYIDLQNRIIIGQKSYWTCSYPYSDKNMLDLGNDYYWFNEEVKFSCLPSKSSSVIVKGSGHSSNGELSADNFLLLNEIEAFAGASKLAVAHHEMNGKDVFVVQLQNKSDDYYMAVVDFEGTVLVSPTKAFVSTITEYSWGTPTDYAMHSICAGLIINQDQDTELYGYIDLDNNTVIPAQYEKVTDFQGEGDAAIAIVNGNTIINRKGEVIFSIGDNE